MHKTPAQKLRDYLKKKYGDTKNIFIRRDTNNGIRMSNVWGENKKK